jgi:phenylpyruvate tautomerase PptA (4-oxalocrotonate tautomerase family)
MPTYRVAAATGLLSVERKQRIAMAITRAHNQVTGAQAFFAQVVFSDVTAGNHFVGGAPLQGDHVFVHGHIRAGRTPERKRQLLLELVAAVARAGGIEPNRIWAYIDELSPGQMAEYGHILPEPGEEASWLAGLPAADRALMERSSRSMSE